MRTRTLSAESTSAPCVLIAGDNPDAVAELNRIFRDEFRVVVASGQAVLQRIRDEEPDLVLVDAHLQGLGDAGGLEACRQVKADRSNADLPVIVLSAQAGIDLETSALTLGAADFICTSVEASVLQARVRTQLAFKRKLDELRRLSMLDTLTGIANRRAFDDALHMEWRRAMRYEHALSLLLVDVDYFKRYNDHYGHPAGDNCLRQLAAVMSASTHRAGDLAARIGGEEFAVVLPYATREEAHAFAEALCARVHALALPHEVSAVAPHVTLSIGVATLLRPCEIVDTPAAPICHVCRHHAPCREAPQALLELADRAVREAWRIRGPRITAAAHGHRDPSLRRLGIS